MFLQVTPQLAEQFPLLMQLFEQGDDAAMVMASAPFDADAWLATFSMVQQQFGAVPQQDELKEEESAWEQPEEKTEEPAPTPAASQPKKSLDSILAKIKAVRDQTLM